MSRYQLINIKFASVNGGKKKRSAGDKMNTLADSIYIISFTRFQISMKISSFMDMIKSMKYLRHKAPYLVFRKGSLSFSHHLVEIKTLKI